MRPVAIMGKFVEAAKFALAVAAIAAAGTALLNPTVSVLGQPGNGGGGGCSTDCSVGHLGTGGVNSDFKAQGVLDRFPVGGETFSGSGTFFNGREAITNTGASSGHRDPEDGSLRGHLSGDFGSCSGKC